MIEQGLRLEEREGGWMLAGPSAGQFVLVDEYLAYLADRNYSPKTVRAYGYDLLAFCRWLATEDVSLGEVTTETLLKFLHACREAKVAGRRGGPNVVTLSGRRMDQYAATTINRRLAAISGLFTFVTMRDPESVNPVPKGREARWRVAGERSGMLAHTIRRPKNRSSLRLREPRRLPKALSQTQAAELLASFHTWRDRAIAGLMLYCGLRSAEVLGLNVADADIGGRWANVIGKGDRQRRVPLDADVASVIQVYLLAERPESTEQRLFLVAKGPKPRTTAHSGRAAHDLPLSPSRQRDHRRSSPRAAAPLRHRTGRSRSRPGGDAGVARSRARRHHRPLYPSGTRPRESRVRCRMQPHPRPAIACMPITWTICSGPGEATVPISRPRECSSSVGPTPGAGPRNRWRSACRLMRTLGRSSPFSCCTADYDPATTTCWNANCPRSGERSRTRPWLRECSAS
ncbi:tyrosine-type recombinase/integrase [Nonomuraea diastatica]|uniref:tyrosine-type recombinase/integrase n=1 Tax=Nonomuraea diastatica TaxID=1848329 RepID=UPI001C709367|nr:site-specific integrase [Nonomuraea diastatica]